MKIFAIFFLLFNCMVCCYADDGYDPNTGILTISVVNVGGNNGTFYSNVKVTVAAILAIDSANRPPSGFDTFDPSSSQLGIPIVKVNGTTYKNVFITVGNVVSVGASCATAADCGVILDSSPTVATGSGGSVPAGSVTPSLIVTPKPFNQVVAASYQPPSLTSVTAKGFTNRSRYLISDSSTGQTSANFLSIGAVNSNGYGATASSFISSTNPTMQSFLGSLVHVVSESDGNFRFDSHLHPNQSLDYSSTNNNLVFENNFGYTTLTKLGYLTFSYNTSTNLIQAKNRYTYSVISSTTQVSTASSYVGYTPTHTKDLTFPVVDYYLRLQSGFYDLVPTSTAATKFYLYTPPIDFGIPVNLNPLPVPYTAAGPVPVAKGLVVPSQYESNSSKSGFYNTLTSKYQPQVVNAGSDMTTKSAATMMLAAISTAATQNNFSLRYSTAVYSAFRDGTLINTQVSDSVFDGVPGQHSVPYVYFTNEQDSSGAYHPFMIIVSYNNAPTPNGLLDIPSPPGQITLAAQSLDAQNRTRYTNLAVYLSVIPMRDYGLVTDVYQNKYTPNSFGESNFTPSNVTPDAYNYHGIVDIGILINAAPIFSVMTGFIGTSTYSSSSRGELSVNGCHVGQGGGGPHCHADSYQSGAASGIGVYSDIDYLNATHPPLIGFGNDGVALFAQYRSTDINLLGYSASIEPFGGHNHDSIGYHYHAHTIPNYPWSFGNVKGTANIPALMRGAYIGNINTVPFFSNSAQSSFQQNKYLGGTTSTAPPHP